MTAKTIIAIRGHANNGKSATIRNITTLLEILPGATIQRLIIHTDIKVIISIGKIVIGIESQGDPGSRLEESVNDFAANYKCNIIICATRTKGETIEIVENVADNYDYRIIWVTNHRSIAQQEELNQLSAEQLVELVKQIIDGKV